jgi:hypothetical protein
MSETTFFRLLHHDDKAAALRAAVAALNQQQPPADTYAVDPASFAQVPGSPFAYWVSEKVRGLFKELSQFEIEGRIVRLGDHPDSDFRYLRLFWEVLKNSSRTWFIPCQVISGYSQPGDAS